MTLSRILAVVIILSLPLFAQKDSSLTLTEVMFNAPSGANQFVELFNLSYADTIDLEYYQIQYENTTPNYIINAGYGTKLAPRQYAVVFQNSYYFSSGVYKSILPKTALWLKIYDDVFGIIGMVSTAPRAISLLDKNKQLIESYTYSPDQTTPGISDEKYILSKDNSSANWRNSLSVLGSPGKKNTVTPTLQDISIALGCAQAQPIISQKPVQLEAVITNKGEESATGITLNIYNDANNDSIAAASELLASFSNLSVPAHDSLIKSITLSSLSAGRQQFIATANLLHDEYPADNTFLLHFQVYDEVYAWNDIAINEIMYAPSNDEPEWVELYNRSNKTVDLYKWQINDAAHTALLCSSHIQIGPKNFLVLTRDSSVASFYPYSFPYLKMQLPPLNNSGDYITLLDSLNTVIDSVKFGAIASAYQGYSLERISYDTASSNPYNWKMCASSLHGTPGRKNSVTPKDYDALLLLSSGNSFDSTGARHQFNCIIRNNGLKSFSNATLTIAHDKNLDSLISSDEILQTVTIPNLSPNDSIILKVQTDLLQAGLQQYIITVNLPGDEDESNNQKCIRLSVISFTEHRGDIIINEIQYAPSSGEGEWFELYNRSDNNLNLVNYRFADARDTVILIKKPVLLPPLSYIVIAKDSSLAHTYRLPSPLYVASFPSLNNDGDALILMDSLCRVIDSLAYPNRGNTHGRSLERISPSAASASPDSWVLCTNKYGASPGFANSVTQKKIDITISSVSFLPAAPAAGDKVVPSAVIKNIGSATAQDVRVTFYATSSTVIDSLFSDYTISSLHSGDSLTVAAANTFIMPSDGIVLRVTVLSAADEDTTNNTITASLVLRIKYPPVVINEIMFAPAAGNPEWIELYNPSKDTADLQNWTVSDILATPQTATISAASCRLAPSEYIVLAKDSLNNAFRQFNHSVHLCSLPQLNDDGDGIVIRDPNGTTVDSVFYSPKWRVKPGRSLERLTVTARSTDSTNWFYSCSPLGGTPGKKNSTDSLPTLQKGQLLINEIMYDSFTGCPAFIEFYNNASAPLTLTGVTVETAGKHNFYLADTTIVLPPGYYYVFSADSFSTSRFPWLSSMPYKYNAATELDLLSTGTSIALRDAQGNTIDSLFYFPGWHTLPTKDAKNHSLEKVNPTLAGIYAKNWITCSASSGATPGKQNSLRVIPQQTNSGLVFSPNPFSPDNDGIDDITTISFSAPYNPAYATITIFDDKGRKVRKLLNNESVQIPAAIPFDGRNDDKNALRIGMYIVLVELTNPVDGRKDTRKGVVVVARKLK